MRRWLFPLILVSGSAAFAGAIDGIWHGGYDSPLGRQEIQLQLKTDGEKLTGATVTRIGGQVYKAEIAGGTVKNDDIAFSQSLDFRGNPLRIDFTGTVGEDMIAITRRVGDISTTTFDASRGPLPEPAEPVIPARPGQASEIGPDDRPAYGPPPASFNETPDGAPAGKLEVVTYESRTVGTTRRMQVYLPPGYMAETKYPVLYLLHGIGGDETEWQRFARVDGMLNRLIAEKKAEPMIVVMPNGRAQKDDRSSAGMQAAPAFAVFERDLLDDVLPAISARYSVRTDREGRAIAGLSMGGGQALNFGFGNPETFAWVGSFSPAPNTRRPADLMPDAATARREYRLLMLTCGNKDGLYHIAKGVHTHMVENDVPHVWHVDGLAHEPIHWAHALHHFVQKIFR